MRSPIRSLAVVVLLTATTATHAENAIPWRTDLRAAMAEAQQSNKLVLLHFWTESCGPCRLLDQRVFTQPGMAGAITANYVPVKVNAGEHPELAQSYGVTRVPTDVVADSQGQVIRSYVSPATPMAYLGVLTEMAVAQRGKSSPYDNLMAAAPYRTNQTTSDLPPANRLGNQSNPAVPSAPMASAQQVMPAATPAGSNANPYYSEPAAAAPPAATVAAQRSTTVPPTVPQDKLPSLAATNVAPTTVASSTPRQATPASQTAAPQLPAGSPPLAFDGYCPVSMKRDWAWKQGDVRYGAIHRGRTYLFTSAEHRDTFLATPDDFAPALSGADPVLAVDQRQNVAGSRQYAVEYRGKFFFFASEETLSRFWTNADGYANGAERVAAATSDTVVR
ncbi:DUF255 domain-containing protein [Botrimarina hoheduenensis]|uniref:Thioredoxin n=1 Tax=Botrimarina hoheduenensis TaxID=2528000 RepID=A0A5C5WEJ1_9BACT|nr:DUF255 domain-containing protein [Botrimarina hoheduenensis]TWT48489.1 Thioredoxin [Botrimarina hoheduenensis]